jgi:hypothetical protein
MIAGAVIANYAKYLAAVATAVPAFQLGLWASAETMRAFHLATDLGAALGFQVVLALAFVPGTVQFALALKLGTGAPRLLVLWFAIWAAGWALLALLSAFFATAPQDGNPVLLAAAMAIVGAFASRIFAPRRVPWLRVLGLSVALWLVVGGLFALIRQGHLLVTGFPLIIALTLATLCFFPLARMERAR